MLGKKELDARFGARDLDQEQQDAVADIRKAVRALAGKLDKACPDGRDKSLAITALEDVEMRAVKAVSRGEEAKAAGVPAAVEKEPKVAAPAEKKIDLRTKEGRALKAAQEAAANGGVSAAAVKRPRSRRSAEPAVA